MVCKLLKYQQKWRRYVFAMALPVVAFIAREIFFPGFGKSLPYVMFFPGIVVAALWGGLTTGLLATTVSAVIISIFILGDGQLSKLTFNDWLGMVVFLVNAIAVSVLCHSMKQAQAKGYEANYRLEKKIAEHKQSQELFFKAFNTNPCMLAITALDDRTFIDVNEKFAQAIGCSREGVIGRTPAELELWADKNEEIRVRDLLISQGNLRNYEMEYYTKAKERRTAVLFGDVIVIGNQNCFLTALIDITDQKKFEKEMAHFERLNLVGEMAASIGHEVRNPLTTVRGYLQLFRNKERYASNYEHIDTMIEELDRANWIITEFLSLAKDKMVELKRGNLNTVLNTLFPLLQADAFRSGHRIQLQTGAIPDVDFDDKELRQLVLNLARNGLEAMDGGGTVSIQTYPDENMVVLAIQDTGKGIPEEVLERIGTPFLTTKENGTGLGLPVCYRIAQRHGAKIDVETSPQGTTFFLRFKTNTLPPQARAGVG